MDIFKIFSILLLIAGCVSQEQGASTPLISSDVRGEITQETQMPSIVGIEKDGHIICTGTLVKSNQIITAAHCVLNERNIGFIKYYINYYLKNDYANKDRAFKRSWVKKAFAEKLQMFVDELGIYFGSGVEYGKVSGKKIASSAVIEDSYYQKWLAEIYTEQNIIDASDFSGIEEDTKDMAWVTLKENIKDAAPVDVISRSDFDALLVTNDLKLTSYGFGWRKNDQEITYHSKESYPYYGYLYKTDVPINYFRYPRLIGGDSEHSACSGDSGGPVLAKVSGKYKLVAINSTGKAVCGSSGMTIDTEYYEDVTNTFSVVVTY